MPSDTTDIIMKAVQDAGIDTSADAPDASVDDTAVDDAAGADSPDDGADTPVRVEDDASVESPDKVVDAKVVEKPDAAKSDEDKVLDAELLELGIKPPKDGRDNRIPYSRMRKIIANALKKRGDVHELSKKELNEKITALTERTGYMDTVDQMIVQDPEKYIGELARMYPTLYGRFAKGGTETKTEKVADPKDDPKPGPDLTYTDGSTGYSPEGLDKLLEWNARQAETRAVVKARAEFEEKYGPIKRSFDASQTHQQRNDAVLAIVSEQRELWGEAFTKDEVLGDKSLVLAAWNTEVARLKGLGTILRTPEQRRQVFARVTAKVLRASLAADRTKIKQELIDEQNKVVKERREASTIVPGKVKTEETGETGDHTENLIREAMAAAGLK